MKHNKSIKHPPFRGGLVRLHKWTGLMVCFFMLMFCVSGLILNHRHMYSSVNVSRKYLYPRYQFHNWNNGLLRGTQKVAIKGSDPLIATPGVLIYGGGGVFLTDSTGRKVEDFNAGLPEGADERNIKSVVQTKCGEVFAVSRFGLYQLREGRWKKVSSAVLPKPALVGSANDLTDLTTKGDSLVVVSRSKLYLSLPPYNTYKEILLQKSADYSQKVSWFKMMMSVHSGEIYGLPTKVLSDVMAIVLILITLTGITFFLSKKRSKKLTHFSLVWHNRLGRYTIILTLFFALTGWFLRPPFLIALVKGNAPVLPGSVLDTDNQWQDRLRMLRWDEGRKEWLLSTADGMKSLKTLTSNPSPLTQTPPISVMGLNTFTKEKGYWVIGSFSGIYAWDSKSGVYQDLVTGEVTKPGEGNAPAGPPIGLFACSGYTHDINGTHLAVSYSEGATLLPSFLGEGQGVRLPQQPSSLNYLPISLWNLALELHSGRLYPFCSGLGSMLFIFIIGFLTVLCLISGYVVRKK